MAESDVAQRTAGNRTLENTLPQGARGGLLQKIERELQKTALETATNIVQIRVDMSYISQILGSAGYKDDSTRWESVQDEFSGMVRRVAHQGHLLLQDSLGPISKYLCRSDATAIMKLTELQSLYVSLDNFRKEIKKLNSTIFTIHGTVDELSKRWPYAGNVQDLIKRESGTDVHSKDMAKHRMGIAKALASFLSSSVYRKLLDKLGGHGLGEISEDRQSNNKGVTDLGAFLDVGGMLLEDVSEMQRNYSNHANANLAKDKEGFQFTIELYQCFSEVLTKFAVDCAAQHNRRIETGEKKGGGFFAAIRRFFGSKS